MYRLIDINCDGVQFTLVSTLHLNAPVNKPRRKEEEGRSVGGPHHRRGGGNPMFQFH